MILREAFNQRGSGGISDLFGRDTQLSISIASHCVDIAIARDESRVIVSTGDLMNDDAETAEFW